MAAGMGNVFETIDRNYYELTASEKKTADYVMRFREETQYLSIAELAERSGVAEATVSRFCRRLGYKGYAAFKLALANAAALQRKGSGPESEGGHFAEFCREIYELDISAMGQTLELLNEESLSRAAEILHGAQRVLCMGQGGSMLIAEEAAHLFSTVSGRFAPVWDSHMQMIAASMLTPEDAVLYFSYSGATRDMLDTLSQARERGAQVLLVTRFPRSPGAALADVVLQCGSSESPLQMGSVAARIAQLFLLDVLFNQFCRRDPEEAMENRRRIASALAEKHL